MILYKYLSAEAGLKVLQKNSIGFNRPKNFNDPFELSAGYPPSLSENPIEQFYDSVRIWAKTDTWSNNTGILSLTRTPNNSLMWAHYCRSHTGIVIGIDVIKAGFTDEEKCLIPAQFGNVIYSETKPTNQFIQGFKGEPICIGHTHHFPHGHEEKISRIFLQKPMRWSYEEEVRIAKCIAEIDDNGINKSGKFDKIKVGENDLYLFIMPKNSIKEVYVGLRHSALKSKQSLKEYINEVYNYQPDLKIYYASLCRDTWNIEFINTSEVLS